jgi:hypothetical protein
VVFFFAWLTSFSSFLPSLVLGLVVGAYVGVGGTSDVRGSLEDIMKLVVEFMRGSLQIRVGTAELLVDLEVYLVARIGPSSSDDMS